tara:strand:+ start:3222 stop:3776 length:555 start_codon:yes stop_codon:yes gene_type:complete
MQHWNPRSTIIGITTATILLSLGVSLPASANKLNLDVEPGLWQHSFSIKTASGELERAMQQLEQQLASMPAAQRQMMEQMMASQGVSFDLKGSSVQVCLTQQDIDRGQLPQQDGCQQQINQTGDNSYSFTFKCDSTPPTSGKGDMTFSSRKAYSGSASFTTEVNGKAEQMTMQQSGKWLSADCP